MKKTKEIWKTYKQVFDEFTRRTLFKLQSEGHFNELVSPIKIGKEAAVFQASKDDYYVAIKIYRLQNQDFNRMYDYIRQDPRYTNLKTQKRQVIFSWVQREYRNLLKAREAGVTVPTPLTFKNNILIEEFIGDEQAADQLQKHYPDNIEEFYGKIRENMEKLHKSGLVHGDLSAFNILNYKENPVLIDFSTGMPTTTPNADEFLERDKKNIATFFDKLKKKLPSPPCNSNTN